MEEKEKHLNPRQLLAAQRYTEAKTQIPLPNMSYKDTMPFISIMGPRNSGKSTLFSKIIFHMTKTILETLPNIITISNSKQKISLHKSSSDLYTYIDCSKISDLIILTINSSMFEMDTFEITSILKSHGLCKVIVAIKFNNDKRKKMNVIKKRLWKEIAGGLKMFDIDLESDISKMIRTILQMKYRPLQWKCSNSYVVADKIFIDKIGGYYDFYGYVRGCPFKSEIVHIPGKGDFKIKEIKFIDDPCSLILKRALDREKRCFYNPKFVNFVEDGISLEKPEINLENIIKNNAIHKIIEIEKNEEKKSVRERINDLKSKLKSKFEPKPETKEDYIEKFNKKMKEKTIETEKEKRLLQEDKNKSNNSDLLPGSYVKITIKIDDPIEFNPLTILGSVNIQNKLIIQGKVKRINYFDSLLKSNNEYLISIGWRREICRTVFSIKDTTRNRFIKYNLENMHCNISFKSDLVPPGTSFCIIKDKKMVCDSKKINLNLEDDRDLKVFRESNSHFRIAASGVVNDVTGKTDLLKKLKLIGYPKKIHENTVFVKEMFSSDKEATKFEGGLIKTVSGIRGCVKKATGKDGEFRATFEGRILMSDIIFMRCYVPYEVTELNVENDDENYCMKKHEDTPKNLTEIVENKKNRKFKNEIETMKSKLTLDKREVILKNDVFKMPINPEKEKFCILKEKIDLKRKINYEENIKKQKIEENLKIKQDKKLELQKKIGLRKNIIEAVDNKNNKKHGKKRTKFKRNKK